MNIIYVTNASRIPWDELLRRVGYMLARKGSYAADIREFEDRWKNKCPVTMRVSFMSKGISFVVEPFDGKRPDPTQILHVQINNGSSKPDDVVACHAAYRYHRDQSRLVRNSDFDEKFFADGPYNVRVHVDGSVPSGNVVFDYQDSLAEAPDIQEIEERLDSEEEIDKAVSKLKKLAETHPREVQEKIRAINEAFRKTKEHCDGVPYGEPSKKPSASPGDIVVFKTPSGFSPLHQILAVVKEIGGSYSYRCAPYDPVTGEPSDWRRPTWKESDLSIVYDRKQIDACRELFNQLRRLVIDRRVPEATVINDSMGINANSKFLPEGFFTVRVPFLFTQIMKE